MDYDNKKMSSVLEQRKNKYMNEGGTVSDVSTASSTPTPPPAPATPISRQVFNSQSSAATGGPSVDQQEPTADEIHKAASGTLEDQKALLEKHKNSKFAQDYKAYAKTKGISLE